MIKPDLWRETDSVGAAGTLLAVEILRGLVAKGLLSSEDANDIVMSAVEQIASNDTSKARVARAVLKEGVLPDFLS